MKSFTVESFTEALAHLQVNEYKHLLIHSSLVNLGPVQGYPIKQIPRLLFESLKSACAPEATIYMPTFAYEFPKTRIADLRHDKTSLGVWPEWFRQQDKVVRSGHPMFSIAGLGPAAQDICQPNRPEPNSFCEDATYARLFAEDTLILFVGIGIRVATAVVYAEHELAVQYRFLKPFFGKLILGNGQCYEQDFYHFCYPQTNEYRNDFSRLNTYLLEQGTLKQQPLGMSYIYGIRAKDLYSGIKDRLASDPFYLLDKKPKKYYQFIDGEEIETR